MLGYLKLSTGKMPQDIRVSPDGTTFYVADMMADGVFVIDGASFKEIGFIKTGKGTHGLYPSRDGRKLYVTNRGSNKIHGAEKGMGSVSVLDFATRKVDVTWPIPAAAAPTWATSAPTASGSGCRAATTTSSTRSTPRPARSRSFRSARSRTASRSGRSRVATRWATRQHALRR